MRILNNVSFKTSQTHLQSFSTSATAENSNAARNTPKHTEINKSAIETPGIISLHLNHNIIKRLLPCVDVIKVGVCGHSPAVMFCSVQ